MHYRHCFIMIVGITSLSPCNAHLELAKNGVQQIETVVRGLSYQGLHRIPKDQNCLSFIHYKYTLMKLLYLIGTQRWKSHCPLTMYSNMKHYDV